MPTLIPPPTPAPPLAPAPPVPPMARLLVTMLLLTVTTEPAAMSMPPLTPSAPAVSAPPAPPRATLLSTVQPVTRPEGTRTREIPPPSASAGAVPGTANRLIAGERAAGNQHVAAGEVEAEDAAACGRIVAVNGLRGDNIRCQRRALGQVVGHARIANSQGADTVDAAALAGAVIG